MCAEIGLGGEALPMITHAITEELLKHKRDAIDCGLLATGSSVGYNRKGPRVLEGVWRDWAEAENFAPRREALSRVEWENLELERDRLSKRFRRDATRRRR